MWVEKSHPAISSPLSLHNSSVGSSEKGTLKRKLRGTSIMEKNSSSYMILYFIRLVGNLYVLYFCVYNDFFINRSRLSRLILLEVCNSPDPPTRCRYPQAGSRHSSMKSTHSSAALARALWHRSFNRTCGLPLYNQFHCFSNSKCCFSFLLCRVRWALTQQGTQLLPLIQFQIT